MIASPTELRRAELRRDSQLDCSAAELEDRRRVRALDAARYESIRRHHRWRDLSPIGMAAERREKVLEHRLWRVRRVAEAEASAASARAICAKPLDAQIISLTEPYLAKLNMAERLQLETRMMMARYETKKMAENIVPFPTPAGSVIPARLATSILGNAATLQGKHFAPVKYIVPGYVAEGCTLLAGRPKVGKSWLMLDVGLAVAAGGDVLGARAEQGDVLYLGLEDNERRLKSRIGKILGPFAKWPERFSYATAWPRQHEGGLEKIEAWIKSVAEPRLIVVDVLARFRTPTGSQNAYEADYAAIQGLQAIASQRNLAIVLIHHLRKNGSESGDAFDKVSGTLGLSGSADTVLVLDRDGQGTALYARGRDIEEIQTAVEFDRSRCRWKVLGAASEVRMSDERKLIMDALREAGSPMSRSEIAIATGMLPNNTDVLLYKMTRSGEVAKAGRGIYRIATPSVSPPPY